MVLELKELINSIKEKTGIDICVFSYSSGKSYATSPVLTVDFPAQEFVGVYSDEEKGKTFFSFRYKIIKYIFKNPTISRCILSTKLRNTWYNNKFFQFIIMRYLSL